MSESERSMMEAEVVVKKKKKATPKPKPSKSELEEMDDEELEEIETILNKDELSIMKDIVSERRMHRDALKNLHQCYKREDARRILENLPYRNAEFIPVIRSKNGKIIMIWVADTIDGLIGDLKLKFGYYDKNGWREQAIATHGLLKKVESQRKLK